MATSTDVESESLLTFEWTASQQPSFTVIQTIADLDDRNLLNLTPLSTVIDPDALNRLVNQPRSAAYDYTITFTYCGYTLQLSPESGTIYDLSQQDSPTAVPQRNFQKDVE